MKSFWQHANGKVYAIQSDTFGHITGAAGPLPPRRLLDLCDYRYEPGLIGWLTRALARHDLHRIEPRG